MPSFRITQTSPSLADVVVGVTVKAMLELLGDCEAVSAFPKVQAYAQRWGEKEALAAADVDEFIQASRRSLHDQACALKTAICSAQTRLALPAKHRTSHFQNNVPCPRWTNMFCRYFQVFSSRVVDNAAPVYIPVLITNAIAVA